MTVQTVAVLQQESIAAGLLSSMALPFSLANLPTKLFINNEFVDARSGRTHTVCNPATGAVVCANVPLAGEADVDAAVCAAEAAFPVWRSTPPARKKEVLEKFVALVAAHKEALQALTRATLGNPLSSADADFMLQAFDHFIGWVDKIPGESFPQDDGFLKVVAHEPYGVTAGLLPWNGPLCFVGLKAAPALVVGNCIILKPSEKTPFACLALGALVREAGFPPGVVQVLAGDADTGALLAAHARIRKISVTGSVATGKRVMALAARSNLKRVTLELGGKSPAVVFADADLDNAVRWMAQGITVNTGQVCFAPSRVYVHEQVYAQFVDKYRAALAEAGRKVGDPTSPDTALGPLVDDAHMRRVQGFIDRACAAGCKLLVGGSAPLKDKGCFLAPTAFVDVPPDAELAREEIFGPVSFVSSFRAEDDVVRLVNDSHLGLMSGVFTQDVNRALRLARHFETGMVGVNCAGIIFMNAPFGGFKESGQGRECGLAALRAWTEPKTIMVNLTY